MGSLEVVRGFEVKVVGSSGGRGQGVKEVWDLGA